MIMRRAMDNWLSKIKDNPDTLVQTISKLAVRKAGRLYFPFLDNLYHGKITMDEIDSVKDNVPKYFSLLVKTKIDYIEPCHTRRYADGYSCY